MKAGLKKGTSLRFKLIVFFVLVAVVPLLAGGIWTGINVKNKLISNVHENNMLVAKQLASQVDQLIKEKVDIAISLGNTANVNKMNPQELKSLITPVKEHYEDIDVIGVINGYGMQIVRSDDGELLDLHDRSYFTDIMAGKEYSISDVIISRSNEKPIVVVSAPIKKDDVIIGVFQISLSLAGLDDILSEAKVGKTGYSYITDVTGKVVVHPDTQIAIERTDFSAVGPVEAGLKGQNGNMEYTSGGKSWQSCYRSTPYLKWVVVTQETTEEVVAEANSIVQNTLIIMAIGALLAALLGILLSNKTIYPLNSLKEGLLALAEGNLTKNVQVKSRDEIGELAHAFNETIVDLRRLITGIKKNSDELYTSSQDLASSSEEVSATVEEMASTANEVAVTSTHGKENADIAARESGQVQKVAGEGNRAVRDTIETIHLIAVASKNISDVIQKLGRQSKQIGEIINTITSIADQTNLLALNAAIEAARAGEHGRGFAVVAEEVRQLAEQSASAAREIIGLVEEIQAGMENAVNAIKQGDGKVKEGVKVANNAGLSLEQIIKAVEMNTELIVSVAEGVKQADEGTQQLTCASEQIASTIQEVSATAQKLANMATEMQNIVIKFKIDESEKK